MSAYDATIERLRSRLSEIQGDVDAARECASWQAVAALHRLAHQCERDLADLELRVAAPIDPAADLSDDELYAGWVAAAADAPDAAIEAMERALVTRRTGKPALSVVEGGGGS